MNLLTKKIPTILGIAVLLSIVALVFYYLQSGKPKISAEMTPEKIRITNIADNKFSVSWTTISLTIGAIEYGPVGEKLASKAKDERDGATVQAYQTHHVTVEGLQPSKQYAFRILVGEKVVRFDNGGSPYTTTTGPVIGETPPSQNFYGKIELVSKQPAEGVIVYLTLPGGSTASTLVKETGNYALTLSTIRSADLRSFVKFDPSATVASLTVESSKERSISSVSLANSAPVPTITLGQNADFLNVPQTPDIAQIDPDVPPAEKPQTLAIFNVEPLDDYGDGEDPDIEDPDINAVSSGSVTIINPKEAGETLNTLRPEFRGTGSADLSLSIALTGQKAISDTIKVAKDGTWSWAPVIDLKTGRQTITVSYMDAQAKTQKVTRDFTIDTSSRVNPAFESSPSASLKPKTPSPTPRAAMPATDSGVPVTGVIENTLLTLGLGVVIMVIGAALLVL